MRMSTAIGQVRTGPAPCTTDGPREPLQRTSPFHISCLQQLAVGAGSWFNLQYFVKRIFRSEGYNKTRAFVFEEGYTRTILTEILVVYVHRRYGPSRIRHHIPD